MGNSGSAPISGPNGQPAQQQVEQPGFFANLKNKVTNVFQPAQNGQQQPPTGPPNNPGSSTYGGGKRRRHRKKAAKAAKVGGATTTLKKRVRKSGKTRKVMA